MTRCTVKPNFKGSLSIVRTGFFSGAFWTRSRSCCILIIARIAWSWNCIDLLWRLWYFRHYNTLNTVQTLHTCVPCRTYFATRRIAQWKWSRVCTIRASTALECIKVQWSPFITIITNGAFQRYNSTEWAICASRARCAIIIFISPNFCDVQIVTLETLVLLVVFCVARTVGPWGARLRELWTTRAEVSFWTVQARIYRSLFS